MTRHSLRIHASPGATVLAGYARRTGQSAPVESCIILAKDLEALCFTLLAPAVSTSGPAIAVTTSPTGIVQIHANVFNDRKARSMQLKCDLRNSTYRSMSVTLQQSLLTPLAPIMAPCQQVIFTGEICDMTQTEHLKRAMAPTLLCRTAIFWTHFKAVIMAKELADAAFEHDGLRFVLAQYLSLEEMSTTFVERAEVRHELSVRYPRLFEAIHIFHLELLITIAFARLKIRDQERFRAAVKTATIFFVTMSQSLDLPGGLPDGLMPYHDSIRFWAYLYGSKKVADQLPIEPSTNKFRSTAGQNGPHQAHDLRLLESLPDQKAILTRDLLLFYRTSIWQLPFPRTSFYKSAPGLKQHNHFKGWQDDELLRSLNADQKKVLNVLQTSSEIEVTDFDHL